MTTTPVPIIDLSWVDSPELKPQLLKRLKEGFFKIGFIYLINHGVEDIANQIMRLAPGLFEVPQVEKDKIDMINNPHFLGYSRLGAEKTAKMVDHREQYDFASPAVADYKPGDPQWKRLKGATPYLPEHVYPGYRSVVEEYLKQMEELSLKMLHLTAESLGLPAQEFDCFRSHLDRLKIIKYPPALVKDAIPTQGVGPHKDSSGLFTYIVQDRVGGLQVLDSDGEWIDVPPIPGSFVVNIAQGFEALTGGRCQATTHRVNAPTESTRYSIAFFQGVRLSLTLAEIIDEQNLLVKRIGDVGEDAKRRQNATTSEFLDPKYSCFGQAHLRNRIISHRDVSERWYLELKRKYVSELEHDTKPDDFDKLGARFESSDE